MKEELISFFNEYCESQLLLRGVAKNVTHYCEGDASDKVSYCAFEGDGFFCRIYITDEGFISHELSWDEVDFEHDISEVFVLFDIDDFRDYSYDNCVVESRIKAAVDDTVGMLFKYLRDIKRVSEGDNYINLVTASNESDDGNNPSLLEYLRSEKLHNKMLKTRSDKDREKYIASLEKWQRKGWLSEYGKRNLKRLKQGIIDEKYDDSEDWKKKYAKYFLLSVMILAAVCFGLCFALQFLSRLIFLSGGVVIYSDWAFMCTFFSGLVLSLVIIFIFSDRLTVKLVPENLRQYSDAYNEMVEDERYKSKGDKIFTRIAIVFVAVFALPLLMTLGTANYSFKSDSYDEHFFFANTNVKYSDCTVYLVEGEYDDDEYEKYDYPYYYIEHQSEGEKLVSDIGLVKNEKQQEQLKEIFDKNNVEIKKIKSVDE